MSAKFTSKALQANLAETRYKSIHIPNNHKAFIRLSSSHYGVHKRAKECITEFHHPLSNRTFVVDELRKILITDFWFYRNLEQADFAFKTLLEIFDQLLQKNLKEQWIDVIVRSLLEFSQKATQEEFIDNAKESLQILLRHWEEQKHHYIFLTPIFKKTLPSLSSYPSYTEICFSLLKSILCYNKTYWESTSLTTLHDNTSHIPNSEEILTPWTEYVCSLYQQIDQELIQATKMEQLITIEDYESISTLLENYTSNFSLFIHQFYYTFFLLQLPGMKKRQERLIWNINKCLRNAIAEVDNTHIPEFIETVFSLCKHMHSQHTAAVLDILLSLGKEIIDRDNSQEKTDIVDIEKRLIDFGFENLGMIYVDQEWQLSVNPNHIKNIRIWLELIEYSKGSMGRLLSALNVNLRLGGIFISDTDLFQRDITKILNSNIAPYYKRIKQLTQIFPVYFNEIGAEGEIRDTTTTMDEIYKRQDRLIHFLRKQVHTESNNTLIELTKKVFTFWFNGNMDEIKEAVPDDVYESIDINSKYYLPTHKIIIHICNEHNLTIDNLLLLTNKKVKNILDNLPESVGTPEDILRIGEGIRLYSLLKEKYSFETVNLISIMEQQPVFSKQQLKEFDLALKNDDFETSLQLIYHFMSQLKEIITSSTPSEGWENIYHKRHIAIGIPSMYGIYREPKFEALGLTFRIERIATRLMEKVIQNINLNYISNKTLHRIANILTYFKEGLSLDGMQSQAFNSNLSMLKFSLTSRSFSLEQYLNLFRFIANDIKSIINTYFLKSYEYPLQKIVPQLFATPEMEPKEISKLIHEKSEYFYREIISDAFLVQPLDSFISRILDSLHKMMHTLKPEWINDIMTYNTDMSISSLQLPTPEIDNQVFLGAKAFYLKQLSKHNLPIPAGFVITTEVFRRLNTILKYPEINHEMEDLIEQQLQLLERISGKKYGDPKNPLLLSVRSGTAISMPGAMNTFLNIGMNDRFTEVLSKKPNYGWTSWDCYRRLLQSWGMYQDISRDVFDQVMIFYKEKYNVKLKIEFSSAQMREIAMAYKMVLSDHNVKFQENLFEQLKESIMFVFRSWSSDRAKIYRDHLQIADEWGTAVIVQQMVLGNLNVNSGTGVVFTHDPYQRRHGVNLYGDFSLNNQGEDIVGGLINTHPISENQFEHNSQSEFISLEKTLPDIYRRLHEIAIELTENLGYTPQELEFTFESEDPKDLYILQCREQDINKSDFINAFVAKRSTMKIIGRGTGIGGGALNGRLVFDKSDILNIRDKFPSENIILVRPDTVPDDIEMIFEANGLLTAKGGVTSHAAVTAARLGKTCVVNCHALQVDDINKSCSINGEKFHYGDKIALDGNNGNIYRGHYPIEEIERNALLF